MTQLGEFTVQGCRTRRESERWKSGRDAGRDPDGLDVYEQHNGAVRGVRPSSANSVTVPNSGEAIVNVTIVSSARSGALNLTN